MVLKFLKINKTPTALLIALTTLIGFCIPVTAEENVTKTNNPNILADSFESTSFSAWSGTYVTAGETATVTNNTNNIYTGNYTATFTSNATGGPEKAYVRKTLASAINESYTQAYFKFTQIGLSETENGDRIKLIELRVGTKIVAAAGLLIDDNIRWWMETRNDTSYVEKFNSHLTPSIFDWFNLELNWTNSATSGGSSLWVNGVLVYNVNNTDTDNYGGCSQVRIGIAEIINSTATKVYADNVIISTAYIGDTPQKYNLTIGASGGGTTYPVLGTHQYTQGEIVQVQALDSTVESDYHLSHWLFNDTNADSAANFTLVMNDNYNLTAVFVTNEFGYEFGLFAREWFSQFGVIAGLFIVVVVVVALVIVLIRKSTAIRQSQNELLSFNFLFKSDVVVF